MKKQVKAESYVLDILGPGGVLEQELPGYTSRAAQLELAQRFAAHLLRVAISQGSAGAEPPSVFVSEAPCGTGKTFAYLVPLIYHMAKGTTFTRTCAISTAGISLQEQLVEKDIPRLLDLLAPYLGFNPEEMKQRVVLLKGVSNFVCSHKYLKDDESRGVLWSEDPVLARWVGNEGLYASVQDAPHVPAPRLLPLFTSTSDECLGSSCKQSSCAVLGMRARAESAQMLVMNHHVYGTSFVHHALGRVVVVDEAHEFPGIQLELEASRFTYESVEKFRELLGKYTTSAVAPNFLENVRVSPTEPTRLGSLTHVVGRISELLRQISSLMGSGWATMEPGWATMEPYDLRRVERTRIKLASLLKDTAVLTMEKSGPVAIAAEEEVDMPLSTAFFSATIRYKESYDSFLANFRENSRKPTIRTHTAESPFDWANQCLVYIPPDAPLPTDPRYLPKLQALVTEIVKRTNGRALVACSSWKTVTDLAAALRKGPHPVLVQGELPKSALIKAFREDVHSILVGTLSLWTGVDVPGEALSALILDKMPFKGSPSIRQLIRQVRGKEVFRSVALPEMANLMAQGFGRLIRSTSDRGVCAILDPRINPASQHFKPYTRDVWKSVVPPDALVTNDIEEIARFLE